MFDNIPASGVWTPWPGGYYTCRNAQIRDSFLHVNLLDNIVDYQMAIHDLAFVLKALFDEQGSHRVSLHFTFDFSYTPDSRKLDPVLVMDGAFDIDWQSSHPSAG